MAADKKINLHLEQLVATIRDPKTGANEFRASLEKIGMYLGAEISNSLETEIKVIKTALDENASHITYKESPVLVTILRAGLPLYQGLQEVFPKAEAGFIGAMRDEETMKATIDYIALPLLKDKTVILIDTMIATAGSILDAVKILEVHQPKQIIVAGAIAAEYGIEQINKYNSDIKVYVAAIDPILNSKGYIVPGLGDAGDRAFGKKECIILF